MHDCRHADAAGISNPFKAGRYIHTIAVDVVTIDDYIAQANANIITLAMIETRKALSNLDAILATPGIDAVFIGPSDLSLALSDGKTLDPHSRDVDAAVDEIGAAAAKAGKIAGAYTAHAERANALAARGFRFLAVASDTAFVRAGIAATWKALKR